MKEIEQIKIFIELSKLQKGLKVPKDHHNEFGDFNFRSCSDILEKVKPLIPQSNIKQKTSIKPNQKRKINEKNTYYRH